MGFGYGKFDLQAAHERSMLKKAEGHAEAWPEIIVGLRPGICCVRGSQRRCAWEGGLLTHVVPKVPAGTLAPTKYLIFSGSYKKKGWLPSLPGSRTNGSGPRIYLVAPFPSYNYFADREFLTAEYVIGQKSAYTIARECGCSHSTILKYLRDFGIQIRTGCESYSKGQLSYGARVARGKLCGDDGEQGVIEQMVSLREEGLSYHRIADVLNMLNIATKNKTSRWHATTVMKILQRREKGSDLR